MIVESLIVREFPSPTAIAWEVRLDRVDGYGSSTFTADAAGRVPSGAVATVSPSREYGSLAGGRDAAERLACVLSGRMRDGRLVVELANRRLVDGDGCWRTHATPHGGGR